MYQIRVDGVLYDVLVPLDEVTIDGTEGHQMTFTSPDMKEVVNLCEHCGRFNLVQIELHSFDELIEHGWIKRVEEKV